MIAPHKSRTYTWDEAYDLSIVQIRLYIESPPNQVKTMFQLGGFDCLIYLYKYSNYNYDRRITFLYTKSDERLGNWKAMLSSHKTDSGTSRWSLERSKSSVDLYRWLIYLYLSHMVHDVIMMSWMMSYMSHSDVIHES